jgi:acetate kinase
MNVFVINCGSSTLKFDLVETSGGGATDGPSRRLFRGVVDRIGGRASVSFASAGATLLGREVDVEDHAAAARLALRLLDEGGYRSSIDAVGHRVVHGGDRFTSSVLIDGAVIETIEQVSSLAPLHNAPSLQAVRAVREALGETVPMVATFDTAFFAGLPARASKYAIPQDVAKRHKIRRYGFHGLAHGFMFERYVALTDRPPKDVRIITLQLGAGCSAAAIANGAPIDTSMGFTPLEGLVMATRSGDIDPSLAGFLAEAEGMPISEIVSMLNRRSGLLGLSGLSSDMRDLLKAESDGVPDAALSIEVFCYRARKYIGAFLAALGGAEAVVFGGGIGENSAPIRRRICEGMDWCGLRLDDQRNEATGGDAMSIHAEGAAIRAYVIPVDEAAMIAREAEACLSAVAQADDLRFQDEDDGEKASR